MKTKLLSNTKWEKLRLAMSELPFTVLWRTKDIKSGFISKWDGDWYYHFSLPKNSYKFIEWVEIKLNDNADVILKKIKDLHMPGEVFAETIKIYGYSSDGQNMSYIN